MSAPKVILPMSKKTKIAGNPAHDPTLPDVSIELGGHTYHLAFTYGALALAERKLSEAGQKVNLLEALDLRSIGAERLPVVLYASLITGHPDITFAEASALITMRNYADIFAKVVEAFVASMSEPKVEDTANPIMEPAAA